MIVEFGFGTNDYFGNISVQAGLHDAVVLFVGSERCIEAAAVSPALDGLHLAPVDSHEAKLPPVAASETSDT